MSRLPAHPQVRSDLEWLAQPAPGEPDRRVVRDPATGVVLHMTAREAALCAWLDGTRSLEEARARMASDEGVDLSPADLEAFVRLLDESGLLVGSRPYAPDALWASMKPLRFASERFIAGLARWTGWLFSRVGLAACGILAIAALGVVAENWPAIWENLSQVLTIIERTGQLGIYSFQSLYRISLVLILVPFLRELAKGVACRRRGLRVPEIRYLWFMRFIPRVASDISAIVRIPSRRERLAVAAAGLQVDIALFSASVVWWSLLEPSGPLRDFALNAAIGTAIGLLFNAMPFGRQDGALLLAIACEEPDLRARARRLFHAWLLRQPAPEPLPRARRRWFILYGALTDGYTVLLNAALFALAGFLLTAWLGGLGAIGFAVLLLLRFETEIRSACMSVASFRPSRVRARAWAITGITAIALVLAWFIPYPYEVGGEFRVQPFLKAEVRAAVSAQIESIPVQEGAWVTNGQPLAMLSRRMIQRELDTMRAALDRELNTLRGLEAGAKPEELARAEQDVKLRETAYEHAVRRHDRQKELFEKNHISPGDYEEVRNLMNIAREELELARRNLELVKSGAREEQIEAQRAEVRRLEIQVAHLEEDLARTVVASPMEGRIATLHLQGRVGQMVEVGTIVAMVEDNRRTIVRIAVPEQFAAHLRVGARVRARPWAFHDRFFRGEIESIAPVAIERTDDIRRQAEVEQERGMMRNLNMPADNVIPVLAAIDNADGLLKSEMTGYAKIEAGFKPLGSALLAPLIRFVKVRVWSWIP